MQCVYQIEPNNIIKEHNDNATSTIDTLCLLSHVSVCGNLVLNMRSSFFSTKYVSQTGHALFAIELEKSFGRIFISDLVAEIYEFFHEYQTTPCPLIPPLRYKPLRFDW